MNEELKPCPFCGNTDTMRQSIGETIQHGAFRWIHCEVCGAYGRWVETDQSPEEAWNTRPGEDALRAEVERLREASRNEWAPIGYLAPGFGERVILYDANTESMSMGYLDHVRGNDERVFVIFQNTGWTQMRSGYTHWRPLPEPPHE